jgi:hypothetical protein
MSEAILKAIGKAFDKSGIENLVGYNMIGLPLLYIGIGPYGWQGDFAICCTGDNIQLLDWRRKSIVKWNAYQLEDPQLISKMIQHIETMKEGIDYEPNNRSNIASYSKSKSAKLSPASHGRQ